MMDSREGVELPAKFLSGRIGKVNSRPPVKTSKLEPLGSGPSESLVWNIIGEAGLLGKPLPEDSED